MRLGRKEMSVQDAAATTGPGQSAAALGPLEAVHLRSRNYRNAADNTRITSTHWHIAWANGLGWGFDGMDGAILALVAPLLMKEVRDRSRHLPQWRPDRIIRQHCRSLPV